jgi:hypothetical protein
MTTPNIPVRSGVDTAGLFAIHGFYRAMQDMTHDQVLKVDAGHPADLVGAVACTRGVSGRRTSWSSHPHDNRRRSLR